MKMFEKEIKKDRDPLVHFYEDFLMAFDPEDKKNRGVWYTPIEIVRFIVKSVDVLLRNKMDVIDGLANSELVPNRTVERNELVPKVQTLDPATGTGTFLAEVINLVYEEFADGSILWQKYVHENLLKRLYGFEIQMASYTVAHIKVDMVLRRTKYKIKDSDRFGICLTDSLRRNIGKGDSNTGYWISKEQEEAKDIYPDPIPSVFDVKEVRQSSIRELLATFAVSNHKMTIFADDNYGKWNFGTSDSGWQGRLLGEFFAKRSNTTFCVARKKNSVMEEGIKQMLREIKVIFDAPVAIEFMADKDIYPLAYVDGRLYFTINDDSASLNECWGDGVLYCIKCDNPSENAKEIDCRLNEETTQLFFLDDPTSEIKKSSEIGKLIYDHDDKAKQIIDKFIDHCAHSNGDLHISYQDEHLKSVAAMVLSLQTIEFFVKKIKKDFDLEFLLEEYSNGMQKRGIFANLDNSISRDRLLENKAESWVNYMEYEHDLIGQLAEVKSAKAGTLTHWRVLNFECNGKRLSIYPDGGLLNGWGFDKANSNKYYDLDTTSHEDDIPMIRQQAIKYEVHIENV